MHFLGSAGGEYSAFFRNYSGWRGGIWRSISPPNPIRGWVVGQEWLQGRFWAVDGRATHARCVRCRPISLALTVRRDFLPRYARLRRCTREYRSTRVPSRPGRPGFVSHVFRHILSSRSTSSDGSLSFVTWVTTPAGADSITLWRLHVIDFLHRICTCSTEIKAF